MRKLVLSVLAFIVMSGLFTKNVAAREITIDHLKIKNVTYTGSSIRNMPKVYDEDGHRVSRRYYSVIFSGDTTNCGEVDVSVTGRNGAEGEASGSYKIRRRNIRQCKISKLGTYKANDGFDYSRLKVSYRGNDVSYRVSGYSNTVGKHVLIIYGLGNFTGKVKRSYRIIE